MLLINLVAKAVAQLVSIFYYSLKMFYNSAFINVLIKKKTLSPVLQQLSVHFLQLLWVTSPANYLSCSL